MRRQHALHQTIQPEPRCKLAGLFSSSFSACLWLTLSRPHRSLGFIISSRRWTVAFLLHRASLCWCCSSLSSSQLCIPHPCSQVSLPQRSTSLQPSFLLQSLL
ncbi:hypothetical protein Nmel_014366 [Mimus melanotis]